MVTNNICPRTPQWADAKANTDSSRSPTAMQMRQSILTQVQPKCKHKCKASSMAIPMQTQMQCRCKHKRNTSATTMATIMQTHANTQHVMQTQVQAQVEPQRQFTDAFSSANTSVMHMQAASVPSLFPITLSWCISWVWSHKVFGRDQSCLQ